MRPITSHCAALSFFPLLAVQNSKSVQLPNAMALALRFRWFERAQFLAREQAAERGPKVTQNRADLPFFNRHLGHMLHCIRTSIWFV